MKLDWTTILCLVYNALIAALGAQVAIHSECWWIFPISGLLMLRPKLQYTHYQICDSCGAEGPKALSRPEALSAAELAGWKRVPVTRDGKRIWHDYCPECQMLTSSKEEE